MGFKRDIADMITEVRSIADMQNTQFVTDDEIVAWLNKGYRRLYNNLLNAYEMYNVTSADLSMVADQKDYDLPSDFLKLVKVFWVGNNSREYPLKRMTLHHNDVYSLYGPGPFKYSLLGDKIRFWPIPQGGRTIRIYYNPAATVFASTDTDVDFAQHQDEYCIYYAARECKIKEDSPMNEILIRMQELEQACIEVITPRDTSDSAQILDVEYNRDRYYWEMGWV